MCSATFRRKWPQPAENTEYERAAALRDRIRALTHVQGSSVINPASLDDADIIAVWQNAVAELRAGVSSCAAGAITAIARIFPTHAKGDEAADVLSAFIAQFYDDKPPPPLILTNHELARGRA